MICWRDGVIKKRGMFCCICHRRKPAVLHEIFPGSFRRGLCVEYNIQAPLCVDCHNSAHGRSGGDSVLRVESQLSIRHMLCEDFLKINYQKTKTDILFVGTKRPYLDKIKNKCLRKLKKYEACY